MKIFVGGSLRDVQKSEDLCRLFIQRLGERIVEREHILLTGCRGSLDKSIAESAGQWLEKKRLDVGKFVVSYRLKNEEKAHRVGKILVSKRADWELTYADLELPEQIADADVTIFVAGGEGTFHAANWARIPDKPVLGIGQFGGAGEAIFQAERKRFEKRYSHLVSIDNFDMLNQDTDDMDQLANDVLTLCENLVVPNNVFIVMSFNEEFNELYKVFEMVCRKFDFEAIRTDKEYSVGKILPRILNGIRHSAFVIADVTEMSPNVFYEVGFAEGLGRPIIATARKGTKLPFDIVDTPVLFWENPIDLESELEPWIDELKANLGKGYKSTG